MSDSNKQPEAKGPVTRRPYDKPAIESISAQEILQKLGPARANYGV